MDKISHHKNLIFGNGRYADLVRDSLEHYGSLNIDGYLVDSDYVSELQANIPQITTCQIIDGSVLYIGFTFQNGKGPDFLINIVRRMTDRGFSFAGFDYSERPSIVSRGVGSQIFQHVKFDIGCSVGDYSQIRPYGAIGHDVSIGSFCYVAPNSSIGSCSQIGDKCFVGYGATLAPGTCIEDNVVIGAGSFVSGTIRAGSIVTPKKPKGTLVKNPYRFI